MSLGAGFLGSILSKLSAGGEERKGFAKVATSILYTMASADGEASEEELTIIREFAQAAGMTAEEISGGLYTQETLSSWNLPDKAEERTELLQLLDSVALADGHLHPAEAVWLIDVATLLGVSATDIAARVWDTDQAVPGADLEAIDAALHADDAAAMKSAVTGSWAANLRLDCGRSLLNAAIWRGANGCLSLLVERGAALEAARQQPPEEVHPSRLCPPIQLAALQANSYAAKILLASRAIRTGCEEAGEHFFELEGWPYPAKFPQVQGGGDSEVDAEAVEIDVEILVDGFTPLYNLASNSAYKGTLYDQGEMEEEDYEFMIHSTMIMMDLLLAAGADINGESSFSSPSPGWRPLTIAIQDMGKDPRVAQGLLERGADLTLKTPDGHSPLSIAARDGHTEGLSALLDRAVEEQGEEAWWSSECADAVFAGKDWRCAEIRAGGDGGVTPLGLAAQNGHLDIVKLLHEGGWVSPPYKTDEEGRTPLFEAQRKGHEEIAAYLQEQESAPFNYLFSLELECPLLDADEEAELPEGASEEETWAVRSRVAQPIVAALTGVLQELGLEAVQSSPIPFPGGATLYQVYAHRADGTADCEPGSIPWLQARNQTVTAFAGRLEQAMMQVTSEQPGLFEVRDFVKGTYLAYEDGDYSSGSQDTDTYHEQMRRDYKRGKESVASGDTSPTSSW